MACPSDILKNASRAINHQVDTLYAQIDEIANLRKNKPEEATKKIEALSKRIIELESDKKEAIQAFESLTGTVEQFDQNIREIRGSLDKSTQIVWERQHPCQARAQKCFMQALNHSKEILGVFAFGLISAYLLSSNH